MSPSRPARLKSLDVFRGATIAAMILVNSPGAREDAYPQLRHAAWNGWTFADTIFPFFLFIVGVSLTLSTAARVEQGADRASLLRHAVRRSALLYASGVFIEILIFPHRGFPYFAFRDHLQLTGVLQKIALCYLVAFLIFLWTGWRGVILGIVGLNLLYLAFLFLFPVPGCGAGVLTPECNFPGYLDRLVLKGHMWDDPRHDPDGLGALLPAITTALFGVLAGLLLRTEPRLRLRFLWLVGGGLGLVTASAWLAKWVPVNKPLWTTSYAVLMAGLAAIVYAASYWLIDVRQWGRGFKTLEILGMNAVAAYLISRPMDHSLRVHVLGTSLTDVCRRLASPPNASLLFAIAVLTAVYLVAWGMYRRGWFLKF
jgi:predicted acyltransferase